MATTITPPDDFNAAVVMLPDAQQPYSRDCGIDRTVQSVFFHYEIDEAIVEYLDKVGFRKIKFIRKADPDGDDEQRALFKSTVETDCQNHLVLSTVRDAFRRLLWPDPLAAVVPRSPRKRKRSPSPRGSKTSDRQRPAAGLSSGNSTSKSSSLPSGSATSSVSAADGESPTDTGNSTSKSSKKKDRDGSASSSEDESLHSDVEKNEDDDDEEKKKEDGRAARSHDIPTLFENLGSEVRLLLLLDWLRCI